MKLPQSSAKYTHRVRAGRYTATRLKKAKRAEQAASLERSTNTVKAKGRAEEDAIEPVDTAIALRDAADTDMDEATQTFRKQLAARSLNADKVPPYTAIFPQGIGYYIAAGVDENVSRYKELVTRVEAALPTDDPLRNALVPAINTGITEYTAAIEALSAARTGLAMARTEADIAKDEWETLMEKIYGNLISDLGKKAAERFFLRNRGGSAGDDSDDPSPPPAA